MNTTTGTILQLYMSQNSNTLVCVMILDKLRQSRCTLFVVLLIFCTNFYRSFSLAYFSLRSLSVFILFHSFTISVTHSDLLEDAICAATNEIKIFREWIDLSMDLSLLETCGNEFLVQFINLNYYQREEFFIKMDHIIGNLYPQTDFPDKHCKELAKSIRARGYSYGLGIMTLFFVKDLNSGTSQMESVFKNCG